MTRILIIIGIAVFMGISAPVSAQQPTQAQLEAFRNLPQAEQERLMRQYGERAPAASQSRLPRDAEPRRTTDEDTAPVVQPGVEHRIEPGDSMIIVIEGEVPGALRGRKVVAVDAEGRIQLPTLERIMVAGLDARQAAERLSAEPALAEATVRVEVLPVRRTGLSELQPFGYELFRDPPTTFAPTAAVPVPGSYVLGPGDIINVQLFGQQSGFYGLEVTREGEILFPNLGPITVTGQTFEQARNLLVERVTEQMIGVRASVTMGPLRTMRIFVLGEASQPGAYTVSALSTATHALFVSGGVEAVGSLRNIQIKRGGQTIARLDLYDLLLNGDTRGDVRLQADDVVFIPPVGDQVAIDGAVRRPAIYELRGERTLGELIRLAGGTRSTAHAPLTRIERIRRQSGERQLLTVDASSDQGRATRLQPGDYVSIASILDRIDGMVRLSGHVHRPLVREHRDGMRISDLVSDIGALQAQADLDYALLRRETGPTRRVTVESVSLARVLSAPRSEADIALRPNDELIVFGVDQVDERRTRIDRVLETLALQASASDPQRSVIVAGHVRADGAYPLEPGMRVSELVRASGGLAESAYALEAEITRRATTDADEQVVTHFIVDLAAALAGDPASDITLHSRDILTIRPKPFWGERETVTIQGEVRFPGTYTISDGELLSAVIDRAGGLTATAHPASAVFMREELRIREQREIDRLADRLEAELTTARIGEQDSDVVEQAAGADALAQQLRQTRAAGRLVINLPRALERAGDPTFDVVVRDGDTLVIPNTPQSVTLIGEVHYPTSHFWDADRKFTDYVNLSGGMTTRADRRAAYIVRANGEVQSAGNRRRVQVEPGDTIVVPLDTDHMPRMTFWTNISQIFYQIGIAAAAWQTVGVF